jgi:hypothetical protein
LPRNGRIEEGVRGADRGRVTRPAARIVLLERIEPHAGLSHKPGRQPLDLARLFGRDQRVRNEGVLERVAHPRGTGDRALANAEIVRKYRSLTRSVIPRDRQAAIEKTVLSLDALDDISELTALLAPTVRSTLD